MGAFKQLLAALIIGLAIAAPVRGLAQSDAARLVELERRVTQAEQRAAQAEHRAADRSVAGVSVFVCAAFCALWAQQTGRNAWLWFFLGLFFTVITLLVLLYKNSCDKRRRAGV